VGGETSKTKHGDASGPPLFGKKYPSNWWRAIGEKRKRSGVRRDPRVKSAQEFFEQKPRPWAKKDGSKRGGSLVIRNKGTGKKGGRGSRISQKRGKLTRKKNKGVDRQMPRGVWVENYTDGKKNPRKCPFEKLVKGQLGETLTNNVKRLKGGGVGSKGGGWQKGSNWEGTTSTTKGEVDQKRLDITVGQGGSKGKVTKNRDN